MRFKFTRYCLHCLFAFSLIFGGSANAQGLQWAKSVGSTTYDYGNTVDYDAAGNSYTVGWFEGTADMDPGPGVQNFNSSGINDIFVLKLDPAGNFVWARRFGSNSDDYGYYVKYDPNGFIYVSGAFSTVVDFDPGSGVANLTATGTTDLFILKLDLAGNYVWAKKVGGPLQDVAEGLTLDNFGNVYATGVFSGPADFDPGVGTFTLNGANDIYVMKLSSAGNLVWAKSFVGSTYDRGVDIAVDDSGNSYLTGYFTGTVDFDPGTGSFPLVSSGGYDIFVLKLDSLGNLSWAKSIGGSFPDQGWSCILDGAGNVILSGSFMGTVDFDPGLGTFMRTSAGLDDAFVLKLSNAGNFSWVQTFGGTGSEIVTSTRIDPMGNIHSIGQFANTADLDPGAGVYNLSSAGNFDVFLQKLDAAGNFVNAVRIGGTGVDIGYSIAIPNSVDIFIAGRHGNLADFDPQSGTYTISAVGQYDAFVAKMAQCAASDSTISPVSCTSYTAADGQVYTSNGTYSATIPNFLGCDSVITINLTIVPVPAQPGTITGPTTICANTTNTYGVVAVPGASGYTWTLPGGWTGNSVSNSVSATAGTNSGNVTVVANNMCGNSLAQSLAVTVATAPAQPGTITGPTTVCAGTTNTYSVAAVPGATSYTWTLPNGWTGNSVSNSMTATAGANSGTITVIANNTCGSSAAQVLTVSVQQPPFLTGSVTGNAPICEGSTNTYSVTPDPNATSYFWILPGGWSGNSTTNSITAFAGGAGGSVLVMASNGCGSSNTVGLPVNVYPIPSTAFNWTSNQLAVTFNNTSQFAFTYSWDFGDGNTSTLQHPVHTYASQGTYNVCLTASDNNCSATICHVLMVTQVGTLDANDLELLVSPNPSTGQFLIECTGPLKGQILDAQGRVMAEVVCVAGSNAIDLTAMADGVYLLMLRGESTTQRVKLLKLSQ